VPDSIIRINGKVTDSRYISKWKQNLREYSLDEAQGTDSKKNVFLYKYKNEIVAISVWTSPKRTKTNPLPRVYTTLSHNGIKITIIPVLKEEGESGEQNKLHPNTIYWMSTLGVYVVIGYYNDAILGKIGKQSTNAKKGKPSKEGKRKFSSQLLELESIKKQIHQIIKEKPDIIKWNNEQVKKIPELLEKTIQRYRELGKKLGVPLKTKALKNLEENAKKWKKNPETLFSDMKKLELDAQNRETRTNHKHESIPTEYGGKAKFTIECGKSEMLYLTADAVDVNKNKKIITITEAKNTTKDDFPNKENIKDDLMKLVLFKKTDFQIGGEKYQKKLRCCLQGKGDSQSFRNEFSELIDECNANNIELRFNNKIIK